MSGENFTVLEQAKPRTYDVQKGDDGKFIATPGQQDQGGTLNAAPGSALDAFIKGGEALPNEGTAVDQALESENAEEGQDALPEVDDQAEQAAAENAEDESSEEGAEHSATIAEAAEALGVEPEVLYGLVVSDGTDAPKTVGELKDEVRELRQKVADGGGAEGAEALNKQRLELEQFTEQRIAAIGQYEQEMFEAAAKFDQAEKWLAELNGEKGLEHAGGDAGKLARAVQVALNQKMDAQQKIGEHQQMQQQMHYGKMQEAMLETAKAIPGWLDNGQINQQKVQADHSAWTSVLGPEYGITEMDVANVLDHRFVRILKDLAELKTKVGKATPEKVKAMRKPKLATTLKQLSAKRGNLGKTNDERARALRRNETRNLPDHDQRKIESLRDVWNARR